MPFPGGNAPVSNVAFLYHLLRKNFPLLSEQTQGGAGETRSVDEILLQKLWNCFPDVFRVERVNNEVGESAIHLKAVFYSALLCRL